jgi:hypothetical protein
MPDLSAISIALSSLNAAKDIAQTMIGLRDTAVFQSKLIELQTKIIDANNAAFTIQDERATLLKRIGNLEQEVADLKAWETEKQRYELTKFGRGFARVLKPEAQGTEQPHQICANCYERGKKSFLVQVPHNQARATLGMGTAYRCSECSTEI